MAKRRKRYMTKRRIAEIQKRKQIAALFIVSAFMISGIISLSMVSNTSMLSKTKGSTATVTATAEKKDGIYLDKKTFYYNRKEILPIF